MNLSFLFYSHFFWFWTAFYDSWSVIDLHKLFNSFSISLGNRFKFVMNKIKISAGLKSVDRTCQFQSSLNRHSRCSHLRSAIFLLIIAALNDTQHFELNNVAWSRWMCVEKKGKRKLTWLVANHVFGEPLAKIDYAMCFGGASYAHIQSTVKRECVIKWEKHWTKRFKCA